ncbi:hypothetical protein QA600_18975 [Natronococcus sp. A-GB1]|uniref:Uncharacterized protein n=1 Tax=Natronococcus amylolyticus DSM 10524 TaxID=1227497 RepID=L9WWK7_9EURY|nr:MULTISPECIES: hypothetical protein [Natronococcus]ELY53541.1 hypothetical protein C491_21671 [Natronococcus amylolyticus DSM 10524]MDG5761416.1 hypothetical protein [Natronococcus sp. A-GB1]
MRIELRVCQHCLEGDHGNERRTEVINDMVACAERIREHKDVIDLEEVVIRRVTETDPGKPESLPVVSATIQDDQIVLNDLQLVTEGPDGNMLMYVDPQDIMTVLAGNVDEISKAVHEDVTVDLSSTSAEMISEADLGARGPNTDEP